jgi:RNA polymerase sigma-70 factor (ECF subfamily)
MSTASASPSDDDEEELARRVRAGDEEAARVLFDRLRPRLRAYVRRRIPQSLKAKVGESDVIQSAYLAAFLNIAEFEDRGDGSFARWVASILDHKVLDEVRRYVDTEKRSVAREERLRTTSAPPRTRARIPSPSAAAIDAEERARVESAMELLSPDHRTVLRLIHERGLTLEEAAAEMGRSSEAVRKLHARAVVALGEKLAGK